jgi:hypothetical protein
MNYHGNMCEFSSWKRREKRNFTMINGKGIEHLPTQVMQSGLSVTIWLLP